MQMCGYADDPEKTQSFSDAVIQLFAHLHIYIFAHQNHICTFAH
jgi:hypothetical protein